MPGPVSDSFDPEWGTGEVAGEISSAISTMYRRVSHLLGDQPPMDIRRLVRVECEHKLNQKISASLTEWEWRIIRFALERAGESI